MEGYEHGTEEQPAQHHGGHSGPPFKKSRGDNAVNGSVMEHFLERADEKLPPNHILLITVINPKYPINVEIIYKVCTIVGKVKKIVCFERMNVTQAMVEFDTLESASKARSSLHGCDIYNNCCTMKVEYSKLETLNVRENNAMSWNFEDGSEVEGKRPVILNSPDFNSYGGFPGGNMSAPGMGGPQNMQNKMGNNMGMGGMVDMNMGYSGYGNMDERSCVMLVYGLEPPKWNCDRLFNLICQYGNVNKIFFMKNKPNTAMVEMGIPEGLDNVTRNLHDIEAFGEKLRFDVSKKHIRIVNSPLEFTMADGTSSVKEYFSERNMNRFITPEMARKNRIIHPSKVLHFFNLTKVSEDDLGNLFRQYGAPIPNQIKFVPSKSEAKPQGVGLCYFNNVEEATEALIIVNHAVLEKRNLKLCYSPAKY